MAAVLERGDICFLFRPRVERTEARGLDDVQRLFVILHPRERDLYRRLIVGRKRLPHVGRHERYWAHVDRVEPRAATIVDDLHTEHYTTRTRGEREQPAARPAGGGVYVIAEHEGHVHLAYQLELPLAPGEVQQDLRIAPQASYIVAVANPDAPPPPGFAPGTREGPAYPEELRARFGDRRFAPLAPAFLDHAGTDLVMIGASEDVEAELGIDLDSERESSKAVELFRDLELDVREHPVAPLLEGEWV